MLELILKRQFLDAISALMEESVQGPQNVSNAKENIFCTLQGLEALSNVFLLLELILKRQFLGAISNLMEHNVLGPQKCIQTQRNGLLNPAWIGMTTLGCNFNPYGPTTQIVSDSELPILETSQSLTNLQGGGRGWYLCWSAIARQIGLRFLASIANFSTTLERGGATFPKN